MMLALPELFGAWLHDFVHGRNNPAILTSLGALSAKLQLPGSTYSLTGVA